MKKEILLFIIFTVFISFRETPAQNIVRGPYLQMPTSTSIIVRWRTDSLTVTNSRVYYGTDTTNMSVYADDTTLTTEHRVNLTGLAPFTKYYYSVGSSLQVLSSHYAEHHFTTSPASGAVQPVRIWAIGDFGRGDSGEAVVRDSYINYAAGLHTDVWLWLGDNVYYNGTDAEYQQNVFAGINGYGKMLKHMPFMPLPGDHDYGVISPPPGSVNPANHTGPYYDIIDVPTNGELGGVPSNTELYYSYDYANIHFISLNSEIGALFNPAYDWTGTQDIANFNNSPLKQWLDSDLLANNKRWVVACVHQPPYSKAKNHDSDTYWEFYMAAIRKNVVPLLEQYGVDLVISGHAHVYQRSYLINGHYGLSSTFTSSMKMNGSSGKLSMGEPYYKYTQGTLANKGTVYVVAGNSGGDDSLLTQHPAMYFAHGGTHLYGSFILDVNADTLTGRYLTSSGAFLDDFTIIKSDSLSPYESVSELQSILRDIRVFPNPFSGKSAIEYTLIAPSRMKIDIYNMAGMHVYALSDREEQTGKHRHEIDITKVGLANGTYFLRLSDGEKQIFEKLLKIESR